MEKTVMTLSQLKRTGKPGKKPIVHPIRHAARDYLERGWKPVPIPSKMKHPTDVGWQLQEITLETVDRLFDRWSNVGLQHGSVSQGLCDLDLDCATAIELAPFFLPETGAIFGRKSAPASHWLYQSDAWQNAKQAVVGFDDPIAPDDEEAGEHGVRLLELRTGRVDKKGQLKGAVSLAPPSRHPSGETVRWSCDGDAAMVSGDELRKCAATLAAATLIVRHYPPPGKQHEAALVLGGWLARAGWDEDRIAHFVEAIATVAKDAEWKDRVTSAKNAVRKLAEGSNVPGWPRMKQMFDQVIVDKLAEWLEIEAQPRTIATPSLPQAEPRTIDEVLAAFAKWLKLKDLTPVYAILGTIAANLLPGDPVWLGLVAPPSSAKTELLNSTARLPGVVPAATLTQGALLSGVSKRQQAKDATGGLLRQIGEQGMLVLKDFGSILSMRPDAKNEMLAALREIYDGAWTRHLGTDGGKTLHWQGKMGMVFGVTGVIDQHYGVMGAMGDRFLLCRTEPTKDQFLRALQHAGKATKIMRAELAEAVAGLFVAAPREPRELSDSEARRIEDIVELAVRLRGAIVRDHHTKDIEAVLGAEGTGRFGLQLAQLLAGLDSLGVERGAAFKVIEKVAYDSVPPQRLAVFRFLKSKGAAVATGKIAAALKLPTSTVRRRLEELAAYDLVSRRARGHGKADMWTADWPPSHEDAL
jgi:Bifunctional DNA primase/polymerase, N-terminal